MKHLVSVLALVLSACITERPVADPEPSPDLGTDLEFGDSAFVPDSHPLDFTLRPDQSIDAAQALDAVSTDAESDVEYVPDAAPVPDAQTEPQCPNVTEVCNGIDDDCDGVVDEDEVLGDPCVLGPGAYCYRTGQCLAPGCDALPPSLAECVAFYPGVISAGDATCVLLDGGSIKCWGANTQGQLGLGDQEHRGDDPQEMGGALPAITLRPATQLAMGRYHTCALLTFDHEQEVHCWGANFNGQLGLGDNEARGDAPDEMRHLKVALPDQVLQIAAGVDHTCALVGDGAVRCWGSSRFGQLGQSDRESHSAPAPNSVDLGLGAQQIALGAYHSCALLLNGQVKCWGSNQKG